jgi:hypothetical protein
MNNLPEFKPLPDVGNLSSNYMSAFNNGMNIYEALVYLQGYVQITYKSMDDLISDWNNFEDYITENISQIANEKTQEILNQWKSDGTLNEIIAQNPLWNQKVNKAGDVMSGDLQFQEDKGVYGTLHSGKKVNMVSHSYTGTDDYTQIGDDNAQAVVHSEKRPVWYDGSKNQDLLVEKDLEDLNLSVSKIQNKIESGAYFTENDEHPTITNYQGTTNYNLLEDKDIVDNLTTTAANKALSANQGKKLNDTIVKMNNFFEYNQNKEIDTGLKWIDGKPIYRRYCKIDLSNASREGDYSFDFTQTSFAFFDECSCLWSAKSYSVGAEFYFYPLNVIGSTTASSVNDVISGSVQATINKDKIKVNIGMGFQNWYNIFYISFLYVKK